MKSIPASVAILGIATLMAATLAVPAAVSAADWIPRAEPRLAVEPMATPAYPVAEAAPAAFPYAYSYTLHEDGDLAALVTRVRDEDPYRYTRERVWPGHGGARLEHHFGMHPDDPERPRYRHYYPYVWGGYAFSAPYFVKRGDYNRREYTKPDYGKAQQYRWGRDYKRPDQWEDGRW